MTETKRFPKEELIIIVIFQKSKEKLIRRKLQESIFKNKKIKYLKEKIIVQNEKKKQI